MSSPAYRRFVDARNRILEYLLDNARLEISDNLNGCFNMMIATVLARGPDAFIDSAIHTTAQNIQRVVDRLRHRVTILTTVSEAEILGRITGKKTRVQTKPSQGRELEAGGSVADRAAYYLAKIKNKMLERQRLFELTEEQLTASDLFQCLPKRKRLSTARPELRKTPRLQEKAKDPEKFVNMADSFVSPSEWNDIVDAYTDKYVPFNRSPDVSFGLDDVEELRPGFEARHTDAVYQWELEQDVTNDFVSLVREGQVDAANQNGYTDFVWIAVVDDVTDDCCLWRDGLLTSEIEAELKKRKTDKCQVSVPPAHFNCRCSIAPVTDAIDEQNVPDFDIGDFNAWLDQKAKSA